LRHRAGAKCAQSCSDCACHQSLANHSFHFASPRVLNVFNLQSLP
jgi:hypothetical protein